MITKLIALLTLLFAPLHISNNIVKDGEGGISETSLSRPQKTTLREIKKARDYNEYYGNNSFNILSGKIDLQGDYIFSSDEITNSMTFSGNFFNDSTQVNYDIDASHISINNISSFYYVKLEIFSGTYNTNTAIEVELQKLNSDELYYIYLDLNNPSQLVTNGDMNGTFKISYIGIIGTGYYHDFNFSLYFFSPINNNNYVPPGDIYTGIQVDDSIDDVVDENYKNTYPLYKSSLKYSNTQETSTITGIKPLHYNYFTNKEIKEIIEPGLNGDFTTSFTLTIDFSFPIKASDLSLYANQFSKIEIYNYQDLFYKKDYGSSFGNLDFSTIGLNDTQNNKYITSVSLSYNTFFITDNIAISAENKVNSFAYEYGYTSGKKEGETLGYNNGYKNGSRDGYNDGYEVGRNENIANKNYNAFTLVSTAFSNIGKLLNVEIYNGLTIGTIVCIPIIFCVMLFIIKMIKG